MIVAMFDDFAPEGPHETAPSLLNYFLGEVKDGTVNDSSLDTAKKWMDATGKAPYYINPASCCPSTVSALRRSPRTDGASR